VLFRSLDEKGEVFFDKRENEFTGKKLLLAEDIEINREIFISLMEGTGLIIDTADNGKEALKKIVANPASYDIILMDIQMPEMDGIETTRCIRDMEAKLGAASNNIRRVPIIAMTANVYKEDIDNCLAAGMDDHIGKPLEMELVLNKLRKYIPNMEP
jgi:CheY-like chemotaxis protein